ncbi:CatB-related O-acetyltransferase [Shewanella mangrovisoli]|uniref:CatB-related O-acetyltransferase n=1 Tax=Shewanella mangrovisoli TaxID=2864211 RepID=A0ABV4VFZ0_9GAMM
MVKKIFSSWLYRLYSFYLNLNFLNVSIGRSCVISRDTSLEHDVNILDYCRLFSTTIKSYSYVSPFSILIDCEVGKYTSIGPGCRIGLGIHPVDQLSTSPYLYNENLFKKKNSNDFSKVIIGNDVWIGANALIMGGVKVGHGAVIGAGAVVTKDVPPYAIVVGAPAKVLRLRFKESEINKLLVSPWWECEHRIISKNKSSFRTVHEYFRYKGID